MISLRRALVVPAMLIFCTSPAWAQTILRVKQNTPAGDDGASWATAFDHLQDALAAAALLERSWENPVEIRIAEGVFRPDRSRLSPSGSCNPGPCERLATFSVPSHVHLRGCFSGDDALYDGQHLMAHGTVLSGDLGSNDPSVGDNCYRVVTVDVGVNVFFEGLVIEGGYSDATASAAHYSGAGLLIRNGDSTRLEECVVRRNHAHVDGGGLSSLDAYVQIQNSLFFLNHANRSGSALAASGQEVRLQCCTFARNTTDGDEGGGASSTIYAGASPLQAWSCIFSGLDTAAEIAGPGEFYTYSCAFSRFPYPDGTHPSANIAPISLTNPSFVGSPGLDGIADTPDDFYLAQGSTCIDSGNGGPGLPPRDLDGRVRIIGGIIDRGAFEFGAPEFYPRLHVSASLQSGDNDGRDWQNALRGENGLQRALAVASVGNGAVSEIWVAEATYRPDRTAADPMGSGDRAATFSMVNGVALYGGFAGTETSLDQRNIDDNQTILSGDLAGDDDIAPTMTENSYHVVKSHGLTTARLDGFYIRRGNSNGPLPTHDHIGAGILVLDSALVIDNCVVEWCRGGGERGVGVGEVRTFASPNVLHIEDSVVRLNFFRGVDLAGPATVLRTDISSNAEHGVYVGAGGATFTQCLIRNNFGHGVLGNGLFDGCRFLANEYGARRC